MAFRMTPARRAALRKAQLASARKRKRAAHGNQRKIIEAAPGLREYKRTGLAVPTPSKTWRQTVKKSKRASRLNKKHGKRIAKHNKRINKIIAKTNRQPFKHRAISKLQGKNPHSRRATFVAEKSARYSKAGRKRKKGR